MFPLAAIWWGNPRLTKTIDLNLVLIMNDYISGVQKLTVSQKVTQNY